MTMRCSAKKWTFSYVVVVLSDIGFRTVVQAVVNAALGSVSSTCSEAQVTRCLRFTSQCEPRAAVADSLKTEGFGVVRIDIG